MHCLEGYLDSSPPYGDNSPCPARTHGGVLVRGDGVTVTAPTIMWVKALDMLMDKLRVAGADFSTIAAISGTAQVSSQSIYPFGCNL